MTLLLAVLPLLGQESEVNPAEGGTPRSGKFYKVSCFGDWKLGEVFVQKGRTQEDVVELEIMNMGYSARMPYKLDKPVRFLQKTEDEKNPYKVLLEVKIPAEYKQPLILLVPEGKKLKYKIFEIDPSVFPYGACQLVNFSGLKLQVALNKDNRNLSPGGAQMFAPIDQNREKAWLRIGDVGTKKLIFSSMMMRRAQKRMLVFLINDKGQDGSKQVKTRMLIDFKPAKKKAIQ